LYLTVFVQETILIEYLSYFKKKEDKREKRRPGINRLSENAGRTLVHFANFHRVLIKVWPLAGAMVLKKRSYYDIIVLLFQVNR